MSKTIAITGCSSGFGRATALHMASRGWRVFASVRKEADGDSLLSEASERGSAEFVTPLVCDITSAAQVSAMGRSIAEAAPGLDALLNNAGTAFPAPLELLPLDALRSQLEVNLIGHLSVTQTLLPLLKAARGTIINVTSVGGRIALPLIGAYNASKFAMEAVSDVLRFELAPFGVRVVVIEPGTSATSIWETSVNRANELLGERADVKPYVPLIDSVNNHFREDVKHGFPVRLFADTVEKILDNPHPRTRYQIPRSVTWTIRLRNLMPDLLWDRMMRRALKL
ncbi:MAG TPA: SDR family NAD(P)-dependent oxidoreductase [Thermodesulfobacteriota bacterium]|nr:SDR family NAD(P)-dependent oxidoreductase [Thermodesulfobacteriota bacterium]